MDTNLGGDEALGNLPTLPTEDFIDIITLHNCFSERISINDRFNRRLPTRRDAVTVAHPLSTLYLEKVSDPRIDGDLVSSLVKSGIEVFEILGLEDPCQNTLEEVWMGDRLPQSCNGDEHECS